MGLHEIMSAVKELSVNEQALLIKHTVDLMNEETDTLDPRLEAILDKRINGGKAIWTTPRSPYLPVRYSTI